MEEEKEEIMERLEYIEGNSCLILTVRVRDRYRGGKARKLWKVGTYGSKIVSYLKLIGVRG